MQPYEGTAEHLLDELRRLDLLLRLHIDEWRGTDARSDEFRGLYISDAEVDRLLQPSPRDRRKAAGTPAGESPAAGVDARLGDDRGSRAEDVFAQFEQVTREIRGRKRKTVEDGTELRLVELADRFGLERLHVDALLLAIAPELDRKYEKIYAYLHDDVTETRPTVGLAIDVLCDSATDRLAARAEFSHGSPLRRNRLIALSGETGAPLLSQFVTVDERIVDFLVGTNDVDPSLVGCSELVRPEKTTDDLPVDEGTRKRLEALIAREGDPESSRTMAYFHGPEGAGMEQAVEAICAAIGTPLLIADATKMDDVGETIRLLRREARLRSADLHVRNLPSLRDESAIELDELLDLLAELEGTDRRVFLSGRDRLPPRFQLRVDHHELMAIHFSMPSYERRTELWNGVDSLPDDVAETELAAKFRLTGGQIADAVTTAELFADGEELTPEALYRGCREQSRETLGTQARKIEPTYGWDDIVLPDDELRHLKEVAGHINQQGQVYSDWGFADKYSLGNGVTALFSGPSGTGKTMAAEIIAADAGLDLYKIDLSQIVSKYIGETEKNLRDIFDEAEGSSAILLFDEADALFGERSEVRDSHDRYANVEVNYLLQRIEEHDGIVILTTNLERNIDDAFRRRIHLSVDFPRPDRDARATIWRKVFPEETPVGDVDVGFLSSFELTGGNIKNIALSAAFMAAEDGDRVEMEHLIRAARREFQKTGKLVNPDDFGEYRELLRADSTEEKTFGDGGGRGP